MGYYHEQFLAFVGKRHYMNFCDATTTIKTTVYCSHSTMPIEHRRQLHHHIVGLLHEHWQQLKDIWCAIFYAIGACAMLVATCRVDIYHSGFFKLLGIFLAIATNNFCLI